MSDGPSQGEEMSRGLPTGGTPGCAGGSVPEDTARPHPLDPRIVLSILNDGIRQHAEAMLAPAHTVCSICQPLLDARDEIQARADLEPLPIDMVLHCPRCGTQHVDAPERATGWTNPPHKSHKCHVCKDPETIWRPADVPTNGVRSVQTRGKADTWLPDDPSDSAPLEGLKDLERAAITEAVRLLLAGGCLRPAAFREEGEEECRGRKPHKKWCSACRALEVLLDAQAPSASAVPATQMGAVEGQCPVCEETVAIRDGRFVKHFEGDQRKPCVASGDRAAPALLSGARQQEEHVEDLSQLIVELVDASESDSMLDRVRRALGAAYERGITAGVARQTDSRAASAASPSGSAEERSPEAYARIIMARYRDGRGAGENERDIAAVVSEIRSAAYARGLADALEVCRAAAKHERGVWGPSPAVAAAEACVVAVGALAGSEEPPPAEQKKPEPPPAPPPRPQVMIGEGPDGWHVATELYPVINDSPPRMDTACGRKAVQVTRVETTDAARGHTFCIACLNAWPEPRSVTTAAQPEAT